FAFSVERIDGKGGERIRRVLDVRHVLRLAPHTVLRAEECGQLPAAAGVQQLDRVLQIARDAALIRDETDAFAVEKGRLIHQNLEAGKNAHRTTARANDQVRSMKEASLLLDRPRQR